MKIIAYILIGFSLGAGAIIIQQHRAKSEIESQIKNDLDYITILSNYPIHMTFEEYQRLTNNITSEPSKL